MRDEVFENIEMSSEEMKIAQQEWLILQVTEHIADLMNKKGITKKQLADKLGRSKGYITQLLDGRTNMTLRTISDVMWALDSSLTVNTSELGFNTNIRPHWLDVAENHKIWSNQNWSAPRIREKKLSGLKKKKSCYKQAG